MLYILYYCTFCGLINRQMMVVLCILPVVQLLLQVLEVLSFLESPEGENRNTVDCTEVELSSRVCPPLST